MMGIVGTVPLWPRREWIMPNGMGAFVECASFDPFKAFEDGDGRGWKRRHRRYLVQPDPELRGPPTVLYREEAELLLTGPMIEEPLLILEAAE